MILTYGYLNAGLGLIKHEAKTEMEVSKNTRPELEFENGYQLLCSTLKDEQLRGVRESQMCDQLLQQQ
jgi:hypothetical protein